VIYVILVILFVLGLGALLALRRKRV